MKKHQLLNAVITTFICILIARSSYAELREMQYEEVPSRIIPDQSYEGWSLLVVETTIPKLSFSSTRGIKSGSVIDKGKGVWWVTLEPGVQLISLSADGYLSLEDIRHNFVNRQAWALKVTPKTTDVNELPVVIQVDPAGSTVKVDGKPVDITGSIELSIASHDIEISKPDYVTIREKITVSKSSILFPYILEKPKPCVVEVTTEPSGAEVLIDGVKMLGVTPVRGVFSSGQFPIKISKEKYLTVNETVTIDPTKAENKFSYRLQPNTGTIVIASDPEVRMDVKLNGKPLGQTPVTLNEQDPGNYEVTGTSDYYTADPMQFTLRRGETQRAVLKAQENFALLTIITTPGSMVTLNDQQLSTLKDIKLSPQAVKLKAVKLKHETVEKLEILRKGDRKTVDMTLTPQVGTIIVEVDQITAVIKLTGDAGESYSSTGSKIFSGIPIGSYTLEVSSPGYKTDKQTLKLTAGLELRERIVLTKGFGGEGPLPNMLFALIPGGSFQMGSPSNESDRGTDEVQHRVTLSAFQIQTTEVTVGQFRSFVTATGYKTEAEKGDGSYVWTGKWETKSDANWKNPYFTQGDDHPVVCISWNDAQAYIQWLNKTDPGKGYRLPTESEWEYACGAGTTSKYNTGDSESDLGRAGWYFGNSGSKSHPVGQKTPNKYGLYDMHGNAWEWCSDWYGAYPSGSVTDPKGAQSGSARVYRGGCWICSAEYCRSAYRSGTDPWSRYGILGFRLVRSND